MMLLSMERTVLAAVCIMLSLLQCQGYRRFLSTRLDICDSLDIQHGRVEEIDAAKVKVVLIDSMKRESTCYEPSKTYNVSIIVEADYKPIYGLLMVKDGSSGIFPVGSLPSSLRIGPCSNGVSHRCNHYIVGNDDDYYEKCSLGHTINIPFAAPDNKNDDVQFRYSIVFTEFEFLENRNTVFSPCPGPETPRLVCNASEFQNLTTARRATRPKVCPGNPRVESDEKRYYVQDGTNYTCKVQNFPIRKKICATGCEDNNGQRLCCKPNTKPRDFDCVPNNNSNAEPIVKTWEVDTTKCICYLCEDVCPPIPMLPDNSIDVEHTAAATTTAATTTAAAATTTTSVGEATTAESRVTTETNSKEQPSSTELDVKDVSIA